MDSKISGVAKFRLRRADYRTWRLPASEKPLSLSRPRSQETIIVKAPQELEGLCQPSRVLARFLFEGFADQPWRPIVSPQDTGGGWFALTYCSASTGAQVSCGQEGAPEKRRLIEGIEGIQFGIGFEVTTRRSKKR